MSWLQHLYAVIIEILMIFVTSPWEFIRGIVISIELGWKFLKPEFGSNAGFFLDLFLLKL